ncbi:hypothetical protein FNL55_05510 [Tardiphaga sp. vice352]|uniref:hypothetical protein n=1 Tax=unclassified Tardiphaga TaxID=2631404 RepID=UPI001163F507|nr:MULTISPECIES: hypothetical protein [unclassified Tardiphaga]QDM15481.1 hypothetical protein FNL53_05650 [Tardiphaga sp. vice278]QDM20512.1 hypothetical protein FIU28_04590 [Tardiphaga sp. vice154]QDM25636.1 hypothetical protein FNL56_05395 [Tardiphaga sp. vice304]QDM30853.1 hypothetical protein FNL55_05510 [Tardiphaga sp. vice352]
MALELASVDLFRIRRSQAETISRWLTDDKALASFERAIVLRLEVHYGLWSPDLVSPTYLFGREMRQIFDNRSNQDLGFKIHPAELQSRAYLIFLAGFFRKPLQLATDIDRASPERYPHFVNMLIS